MLPEPPFFFTALRDSCRRSLLTLRACFPHPCLQPIVLSYKRLIKNKKKIQKTFYSTHYLRYSSSSNSRQTLFPSAPRNVTTAGCVPTWGADGVDPFNQPVTPGYHNTQSLGEKPSKCSHSPRVYSNRGTFQKYYVMFNDAFLTLQTRLETLSSRTKKHLPLK